MPMAVRPIHFDHIATTFDERGDPVAAVIDDFLCEADRVRNEALGHGDATSWSQYNKKCIRNEKE